MSLNGISLFDKNLRTLMNSKIFQEANVERKFDLGYKLLNSKYGTFCISSPKELKTKNV